MPKWGAPVIALLFCSAPQVADACSCDGGTIDRRTLPADSATDFPTDGTIRVFVFGAPRWMKVGLLEEYRLQGPQGLVALEGRVDGTLLSLRPKSPLLPRVDYTLERIYAYDENGERLTDSQREKIARYGGMDFGPKNRITKRLWFPEVRFRTAAGPEQRHVTAPKIEKAEAYRDDKTSCGPGSFVRLELRLPTLLPTDVLGVDVAPSGVTFRTPAPTGDEHKLSFGEGMCVLDEVSVGFYEKMQARVFVLTAAGRRVEAEIFSFGGPFELHGRDEPMPPDEQAFQQVENGIRDTQTSRAFFAAPIGARPDAEATGPEGCPHGLQEVEAVDLPPGRLAWTAMDVASAGWRDSKLYALYMSEESIPLRVLAFTPSASAEDRFRFLEIPGGSDQAVALFERDHIAVAWTVFQGDSESQLRVAVVDYDGEVRWSRSLGHPGIDWRPQLAERNGRLLVAWTRRDDSIRDQLAWAVLSVSDGTASKVRTQPGGGEGRFAAGYGPKGLLLAWVNYGEAIPPVPTSHWAWINDNGELENSVGSFPPRGYQLQVASDETQPSLLFGNGDQAQLIRLGSSSAIPLSAGGQSVRHPAAAGRHGLLYAAWASEPTGGQITAVDSQGRVAPLTDIRMEMTIPHVVVTPAGVWVLGQEFYAKHPVARRFHCRDAASANAPARLP